MMEERNDGGVEHCSLCNYKDRMHTASQHRLLHSCNTQTFQYSSIPQFQKSP